MNERQQLEVENYLGEFRPRCSHTNLASPRRRSCYRVLLWHFALALVADSRAVDHSP